MDYKDLYPKLNEVLESISPEELSSFARSYALCNKDMALALVERYWQPDAADYRQVVDACFVHPFVVCTKFGESLDWNAVIEDVIRLSVNYWLTENTLMTVPNAALLTAREARTMPTMCRGSRI